MRIERIALAALLLCAVGCATEHYETGARNPEVAITADGGVTYRGKFVDPEDLPGLLKDSGFTKQDTINIHAPEDLRDMRAPRRVMAILSRNGFTRPILPFAERLHASDPHQRPEVIHRTREDGR